MIKKAVGNTRIILLIFLAMATLMISSALIELNQSKQELFELLENQAHSLLESVSLSSANALNLNHEFEGELRRRLLNNANLVKSMYDRGNISDNELKKICSENDLLRINIFNRNGKKIYSSHQQIHTETLASAAPQALYPIFNGSADTLILGLRAARFESGYRYTVAVAAPNRAAIVVNLNAEHLLNIRRELGFGVLMRQILENPDIIYVALQDTQTILAGSGGVQHLAPVKTSDFLLQALQDSVFMTRKTNFDTIEVFEAVHPFIYRDERVGVFRIGLSLQPIDDINTRIYRRMIIITIVLIFSGSLIFTFLFIRQRYDILQKQYQEVETYSGNIIRDVSDAIIVFNEQEGIKIYNQAAELLFDKKAEKVLGMSIEVIFPRHICSKILEAPDNIIQIECPFGNRMRILLISKTAFNHANGESSTVLVIRDMTEQKTLENRIQRQERLSAMGELASGVAHEIRNPLNTIGTIIQQLDTDFEATEENEEFHQLVKIVYKEVRRIDTSINDFLKFSRPEKPKPTYFPLRNFFDALLKQYQSLLQQNHILAGVYLKDDITVFWDKNQIQQALMNLIQNAIDAVKPGDKIDIRVEKLPAPGFVEILFSDTGHGMKKEVCERIFNLYYTTKSNGTGIGLSMVQRIIYEHNGSISVESKPGEGTRFIIRIPAEIQKPVD